MTDQSPVEQSSLRDTLETAIGEAEEKDKKDTIDKKDDIHTLTPIVEDTSDATPDTPQDKPHDKSPDTPQAKPDASAHVKMDKVAKSDDDLLAAKDKASLESDISAKDQEDESLDAKRQVNPPTQNNKPLKAPASWTPAIREHWAQVPPAIQAQVVKREKQITDALQEGAVSRKLGDRYQEVTNRYQSVIAAEGIQDPVQGFEQLMGTMSLLRMGSPAQKAQKIADFIQAYEVDIDALDNILAGDPATATPNPAQQQLDARLAPIERMLAQQTQQTQQRDQDTQHHAAGEVNEFGTNKEFFEDVRQDMADLLDMSARQGRNMTLTAAYDKACLINPQVSEVMQLRARTSNTQALAAKSNAASSISGRNNGATPPGGDNMSMRDLIASQWPGE